MNSLKSETVMNEPAIESPRFSVVIPLFNKSNCIARAIDSVLGQTCEDYEIVVVDDGSTDDGAAVVEALCDSCSSLELVRKRNGGVSSARNLGALRASGRYLAFLDADDKWQPEFLANMDWLIGKYPEGGAYGADWVCEYRSGEQAMEPRLPEGPLDYFRLSLARRPICSSSVIIPRDIFMASGGFDEALTRGEDLDLWARIAREHPVYTTGKVLATYYQDAENRACAKAVDFRRAYLNDHPSIRKMEDGPYKDYLEVWITNLAVRMFKQRQYINYFRYTRRHFGLTGQAAILAECLRRAGSYAVRSISSSTINRDTDYLARRRHP